MVTECSQLEHDVLERRKTYGTDAADLRYTGDFETVWQDVQEICKELLKQREGS